MRFQKKICNGKTVAVISGKSLLVTDTQSALDLIVTVKYEAETNLLAIDKAAVIEDFFVLSRGVAGEILQKFINYQMKVALFGDFSKYKSQPLKDFIYESNNGKDVFFASTEEEAIWRLTENA